MAYLAIAYPELSEKDLAWIQEYRRKNDPRYFNVVKPHFSFVFPISDLPQAGFLTEIKQQIAGATKIEFELRVATVNKDGFGDFYHEFLVPEKGYANIVKLHDKLYSGGFSKYLRLDIDFIPHIGIGNSEDAKESKCRVDSLNQRGVSIPGHINSLDIVEYENDIVKTIEKIELK